MVNLPNNNLVLLGKCQSFPLVLRRFGVHVTGILTVAANDLVEDRLVLLQMFLAFVSVNRVNGDMANSICVS